MACYPGTAGPQTATPLQVPIMLPTMGKTVSEKIMVTRKERVYYIITLVVAYIFACVLAYLGLRWSSLMLMVGAMGLNLTIVVSVSAIRFRLWP